MKHNFYMEPLTIRKEALGDIIKNLFNRGYRVIGPTVRGGTIGLDNITAIEDLPVGYGDRQVTGGYSLFKHEKPYFFGFSNGPDSLKRFLNPPYQRLFAIKKRAKGFETMIYEYEGSPFAFIGIRACDLKALHILDMVFEKDPFYQAGRKEIFIIAVNCIFPSNTCFCPSMNSGPEVKYGFDLLLTEFDEDFLMEVGSKKGLNAIEGVHHKEAAGADIEKKRGLIDSSSKSIKKTLDTEGLPTLLYRELENPWWADIASRDLSCGNCTMVCPTCFCNTSNDTSSLDGKTATRIRCWDSCFSVNFARVHGGNFRPSRRARYRQWMTHKLAYWINQFGVSGCVGCGRCITWCPAGIDITEELTAIRISGKRR